MTPGWWWRSLKNFFENFVQDRNTFRMKSLSLKESIWEIWKFLHFLPASFYVWSFLHELRGSLIFLLIENIIPLKKIFWHPFLFCIRLFFSSHKINPRSRASNALSFHSVLCGIAQRRNSIRDFSSQAHGSNSSLGNKSVIISFF